MAGVMVNDNVGFDLGRQRIVPGSRLGIDHREQFKLCHVQLIDRTQIQPEIPNQYPVLRPANGAAVGYRALNV